MLLKCKKTNKLNLCQEPFVNFVPLLPSEDHNNYDNEDNDNNDEMMVHGILEKWLPTRVADAEAEAGNGSGVSGKKITAS